MNTTTLIAEISPVTGALATTQRLLSAMLDGCNSGVEVRLWNGDVATYGSGPVSVRVNVNNAAWVRGAVMKGGALAVAEAYIRGDIDFECDIFDVLKLRTHLEALTLPLAKKLRLVLDVVIAGLAGSMGNATGKTVFKRAHSRQSDKDAIAFHYDVSNAFFGVWLDSQMLYSCAYFENGGDSLELAQRQKLDHVCRKLRLKKGERLLDIGCGWGAMVCWAAKHYGVRAHGITLSEEQLKFAQARIKAEGLEEVVTVELRDYRDLQGTAVYDKVSSIGMFEHVGLRNLATYNATVNRLLKADGLFLNHGITHDTDGWETGLGTAFLHKFVFPDGELDRVSGIQAGMEHAGFEILDVESLRPHYAKTLRCWVRRLESQRAYAVSLVGESQYRVWLMYMAGSALAFEGGGTGIHQILAGKTRSGKDVVPLTRRDIYRSEA
jgi:cyclopropane-fatty-acyl-phospholipid synthase